jgi:hypothetical protein
MYISNSKSLKHALHALFSVPLQYDDKTISSSKTKGNKSERLTFKISQNIANACQVAVSSKLCSDTPTTLWGSYAKRFFYKYGASGKYM